MFRDEPVIVQGRVLNALTQKDERNAHYPMRLMLDPMRAMFFPQGVPPGYRYLNQGPILDQGNTGTCVGHGGRNWLSAAPLMTKTGPSPFQIYRGAVLHDQWTQNDWEATAADDQLQFGTSVLGLAKHLQAQGHIKHYLWAQSIEDVRAWLLSGLGVLIIGVAWTHDMFETDQHGFIRAEGTIYGGHCVVVGGWNDNKVDPVTGEKGTAQITNTWGRTWGRKGRAYITRSDLDRLLFDPDLDGECCAAVEQKVTPVP